MGWAGRVAVHASEGTLDGQGLVGDPVFCGASSSTLHDFR
jgi:hypothetical protein